MPPLLRLAGASLTLHGQDILHDLDWSLNPGESWAVTGPNGAGKSSFFRLIRGELWPSGGERRYALDGRETRSPLPARERFAIVSPELHDWYARSDWTLSSWQVVLSGTVGGQLPPYPLLDWHEARARAAVDRLGLHALMDRDVRFLSQGQRRQVLLARALALQPRALILDEFWEGVDGAARARLRTLVEGLLADGLTVLYSTHRRDEFLQGTTHELRLEGGRITAQGRVRGAAPTAREVVRGTPGVAGEVVLEVANATVYREENPVLRDVNWQLRGGEHWAVLGGNGAGKSTLLRLVAGEVFAAVGAHVRRFDLPPRATLEQRRQQMVLVSAEEQARHRRDVSGETILASGFFGTVGLAGALSAAQRSRLQEVAARLGVQPLLERSAQQLSHGQLKKLLFARALVSPARLLLLDEPFDYLDDAFRAVLLAELEALAAAGRQLVFVVHRLGDLPPLVTHALLLEDAHVAYQGPLAGLPATGLFA